MNSPPLKLINLLLWLSFACSISVFSEGKEDIRESNTLRTGRIRIGSGANGGDPNSRSCQMSEQVSPGQDAISADG